MLAQLAPDQLDAYFAKVRLRPMTDKTMTNQKRLRELLIGVRQDGYAINDEELELGLRSIAVPVRGAAGQVVAALNVGAQAARVSVERMREEFLPVLLRGAQELAVLLP
jgi:IclR family pca regulon transcriptional regulator